MADRKENRKNNILYSVMKMALVLFVLFGALLGGSTFAKYYSMQKQKGVAVASDFYFSSDVLKSGVTVDENHKPDFNSLSSYVATTWSTSGNQSVVNFMLRNYDNNLLYNDKNIEITYSLYAQLAATDTNNITYYLVDKNNTKHSLSADSVVEISDTLLGGDTKSNSYYIQYEYPTGTQAMPVDVYVWAVPTAPNYMPKNQYSMGSVIGVQKAGESVFTFDAKWDPDFITFENSSEPLTDAHKQTIDSQIGFVYNISTTGSNTDGLNSNKVTVRLSWNSDYVEIDRFNKYYTEAKVTTNGSIKTLTFEIDTYTSNDILFYRKTGFSVDAFVTQGEFQNLVTAVRLNKAEEEAVENGQ